MDDSHINNSSSLCTVLMEAMSDGALAIQQYALICMTPFPLIINSAVLYYLSKNRLFEKTFKLLLGSLSVLNIIFILCTLIYGVHLLYIYNYEPCQMISTVAYCTKFYTLVAVPLIGIPSTILALSIERLCASVYYKRYDGKKSTTLPAVLLSFVLIVIFLVIVPPSILNQSSKDFSPKLCGGLIKQSSSSNDFPFGVLVGITMEIVSMSIFTYIHFSDNEKYRSSLNRAINRLNIRYQLMFNIQLNKALLSSNVVCLPCFTLANLCLFASSTSTSFKSQTIYSNFIFVFINLFATFQPLMFFVFYKWFKELLMADLEKLLFLMKSGRTNEREQQTSSIKPLDVDAEGKKCDSQSEKYFDHLEKMWN